MTSLNLIINEKAVEVEPGSTLLEAAQKAGCNIPTLCHHPQLHPYGSCRLCLVEVEGARTLMPACTVPAGDKMVVHTDTERVKEARKFVLSMLFSERNHFCMYCVKTDGDCELQQAAYHEGMSYWPITPSYNPFLVDASHPDIMMDTNRCILCRRCVRTCGELVGNFTLGFEERGSASQLIADHGVPLGGSSCISCGNCVQHCPTGSLFDRFSAYKGRKTDLKATKAVCTECSVGCERNILTRANKIVRVEGDEESPFNDGLLCVYGRYKPVNDHRERLTRPMVRKNGILTETSWEEALNEVSEELRATDRKNIHAAISPRQSVEDTYAMKEFFMNNLRVADVHLLDHNECSDIAKKLSTEIGPFESNLEALKDCDAALVFGADLTQEHQVAGFFLKRQMPEGMKLFYAGSKPGHFGNFANDKIIYLGHDFANIVNAFAAEDERQRENLAKKLGLNARELKAFTESAHNWKKPVIVLGSDLMYEYNIPTIKQLLQFRKAVKANLVVLKGKSGTFAASLMGIPPVSTSSFSKIGFFVTGDDVVNADTVQAVDRSDYKVFMACVRNELTERADVILPVSNWAECESHYLTGDGKLKVAAQAIQPEPELKPIRLVFEELAKRHEFEMKHDWKTALKHSNASVELVLD
ncbi:MAG: 2Fe-2S iron-sulfur cluster-binding protein [Anaerolineaceae bacterium]|nr:2Fe-2S iron-sulfur cluster-binding protein [Anaerolineaceae bacterium]